MGYLGKQPALQASEYREEFNITSTTTNIITSGFVRTGSSNYLEVYRNGVLLGKADYTLQSDYKTIVLTNAAVAGDIVVVLGRRNLTQGLKVAERRHEHVIQNGETTVTFPFPLTADITDVYINGVKLWYGDGSGDGSNSDYAINPVTRVISFGLNPSVGDTVSIVSREPTSVSSTPLPLIDSNGASVISENGGVISLSADTAMIEGSSSGDLVRITQTGSGNALVVEDSANPDSTPFVVNASGYVGIGTTTLVGSGTPDETNGGEGIRLLPFGFLGIGRNAGINAQFNRSDDGSILGFRRGGASVGSIGVRAGDNLVIHSTTSGHWGLEFGSAGGIAPTDNTGAVVDNVVDLGNSNSRFDDIYATNGTIQTSDRNEKQDIEELSEAEQRVAVAAKSLMRKFRWKSAVAKKGDEARIHFGIIAQDLQDAFEAEGLDAGRYAMFISSTWWETSETYIDDEGVEQTRTNTYDTAEEAPEGAVERTRLGVRYSELLAFIIAAL